MTDEITEIHSNPKSSYFSIDMNTVPSVMDAQRLSEQTYNQKYNSNAKLKSVGQRIHDAYHVIVMEE